MKNIWHNADKLLEEYEKRNSGFDEPADFDDFAIEMLAEEPLDTLLSERGITREQALSEAKAEREIYNEAADRLGIKSREFPWLWIELIEKCESNLTEDNLELLLWLVAAGRFSDDTDDFTEREAEELAIRRWLGVKDRVTELKDYYDNLRDKLSEFKKILVEINSIKTFESGSSDENDVERVFSVICGNDFAEKCENSELLHNNLDTISQMINEYDFLAPIKPLVYFQAFVRQQNKVLNKDGFAPNLKKLFEYREYGIFEDNEKNFKQYAEYCRLYSLMKNCFSDADKWLCDAGFMYCSNLAEWFHNLGYMNYRWCDFSEDVPEIPATPQAILREMCVKCFDEPVLDASFETLEKWRSTYPKLCEAIDAALDNLRFEELGNFAKQRTGFCDKFFTEKIMRLVTQKNHNAAWGLLVRETERRFDELLEQKICGIFDKYYLDV